MNRLTYSSIFLMVIIFFSACTLEEPVLPNWLARWVVPFESSYNMEEILEEPNFVADTTLDGKTIVAISVTDSTEERTVSSSDLAL